MLEHEYDYILERLASSDMKWDCFLSHVQKHSADVCGRIAERVKKLGVSFWLDKEATRVDTRGMVYGVINSRIFVVFLTTDYFASSYCVFEYCVALMAGKSVITVGETDPRFGGAPVGTFDFHELFKHTLNHEVVEINRTYWDAFILKL